MKALKSGTIKRHKKGRLLDSKLNPHMQTIKLVIPALYKPHEKVMSKARHIWKSINILKNTKKNVATVNADMMLITEVQ